MRALGRLQLDLLAKLASPSLFLVVGKPLSTSLVRRGLMRAHGAPAPPNDPHGGFVQITPAGLRALADAWEAGRLSFDPPSLRAERKGGKADG